LHAEAGGVLLRKRVEVDTRACATEQHCHGKDVGVPRADRVKLNAAGLDMPSVDHMSNNSSLNVVVDRILWIGRPAAKL